LAEAQLEDLVDQIALYPDALLANVLPAATVPLDVVAASQYLRKKGGKVDAHPAGTNWDESVEALLEVPDVLNLMADDISWTNQLGDAVVNQQADVMAAIQAFRRDVNDAGNLVTTEQQIVVVEKEVIVIMPSQNLSELAQNNHARRRGLISPCQTKAGEGTRTLNIQLGRLTLYQLSYARRLLRYYSSTWVIAAIQVEHA
jgi:hypothetical protein